MKTYRALFFIFFAAFGMNAYAQDVITFTDGTELNAKVREVTQSEIRYVKSDNPDGPLYTIDKKDVFMIKYQNGTRDVLKNLSGTSAKAPHFRKEDFKTKYRSPGLAFLFSALIPGGGQYYNHDFLKGGIMTGAWMAGSFITFASVGSSLDCTDHGNNNFSCHYDEDQAAPGVALGTTVMFGSWLWSVIDAPIRAARHNKKMEATGLLEFQKQDKFSMRVEPFNSTGLGGSITMNF